MFDGELLALFTNWCHDLLVSMTEEDWVMYRILITKPDDDIDREYYLDTIGG